MLSLDGTVQRRSRYGRSTARRKRIAWEKIDEFVEDYKTSWNLRLMPAKSLSLGHNGRCCKADILECAEISLSSLNEKSRANQGAEYELVEVVNCIQFPIVSVYHCNFIARPKNGSEAENKLFFAEVKWEADPGGNGEVVPYCHFCYSLGPIDSKTGLGGCSGCDRYPSLIQHPEEEFTKFDWRVRRE